MGKIFKGDTAIKITAICKVDITGALVKLIKYEKPSGDTGSWTAQIETLLTGEIYYNVVDSDDLDESGEWTFWGYIQFANGTFSNGEVFKIIIHDPGQ